MTGAELVVVNTDVFWHDPLLDVLLYRVDTTSPISPSIETTVEEKLRTINYGLIGTTMGERWHLAYQVWQDIKTGVNLDIVNKIANTRDSKTIGLSSAPAFVLGFVIESLNKIEEVNELHLNYLLGTKYRNKKAGSRVIGGHYRKRNEVKEIRQIENSLGATGVKLAYISDLNDVQWIEEIPTETVVAVDPNPKLATIANAKRWNILKTDG